MTDEQKLGPIQQLVDAAISSEVIEDSSPYNGDSVKDDAWMEGARWARQVVIAAVESAQVETRWVVERIMNARVCDVNFGSKEAAEEWVSRHLGETVVRIDTIRSVESDQ